MSIEGNGSVSSFKVVAGTENQGMKGRGKAKTGSESDALAGGGFSALLTSLEPPVLVGVGGAGMADQSETAIAQQAVAEGLQMPVLTPSDPAIFLAQNLPLQAAILAASGPAAGDATNWAGNLAALLAQTGEVAGGRLSAGSDARPVVGHGGVRLTTPTPAMGADKPELSVADPTHLGNETTGDFTQYLEALLAQSAQTQSPRSLKTGGADLLSGAGASLAEARALRQPALADVSARDSAIAGALVTAGIGDTYQRQVDRASLKSSAVLAGSGIEGLWGQQALLADGRMDAPSALSDPSTQSLESMVADTVSYWVSQGVQSAELKLDGFGDEPVEVTISLKGGEAHIDFRTDQPEIRQVLEGAVAHLTELLASEGLTLSEVSVGTSGQNGAGTQERRHDPDVRQVTMATAGAVATESPKRANLLTGRVVDLFV